jgi:hypothetical protein
LELKNWRGQTAIRINTDATKATFQRARESEQADFMRLTDSGQYDQANALIDGSKYIPADDKVRMKLQLRDRQQEVEEQSIIDTEISVMSTDPRKWLEEKKDYKPQNAKEMQRMEWLKNRAQATIHDQTTEASDRILNALATAQSTAANLAIGTHDADARIKTAEARLRVQERERAASRAEREAQRAEAADGDRCG